MKINKKHIVYIAIGALVGAAGGYAYWMFIGCESGTCPITSKPLNSTLYGVLMGGLLFSSLFDLFNKKNKSNTNKEIEQ
jgi:uncharacterized membrane protein